MRNSKSKTNHLMHLFELENDYLHHRKKIVNIRKRDAAKIAKKTYNSQMNMINSFHKNFSAGESFKVSQRQRTITQQNKMLHKNLMKEYRRPIFQDQSFNSTLRSNRSSDSAHYSQKRLKTIGKENQKMIERILCAQSSLSKNKMVRDYKKTKETKKRLETMSSKNRTRLQIGLRKMKVEPRVSFPKVRHKKYQ